MDGQGEILFEDGRYRLIKHNIQDRSFLFHSCAEDPDHSGWLAFQPPRLGACPYCKEKPSDEIVGLFLLHNWDDPQKSPRKYYSNVRFSGLAEAVK
jgi:hypothetical protein